MTYSLRPLLLLVLGLSLCCCQELTLTDDRARPEPPALPAPAMECPPVVHVAADKTNVLWVGLENPVTLEAEYASLNSFKILVSGGKAVFHGAGGEYIIRPYEAGEVRLLVLNEVGLQVAKKVFRAKRVPSPMVRLGNKLGGNISAGQFKAQAGINALLDNFDFDLMCQISGFVLTRVKSNGEVEKVSNQGGKFDDPTLALTTRGEPGDHFLFTEVKVRCPGDSSFQAVNSLAFSLQ